MADISKHSDIPINRIFYNQPDIFLVFCSSKISISLTSGYCFSNANINLRTRVLTASTIAITASPVLLPIHPSHCNLCKFFRSRTSTNLNSLRALFRSFLLHHWHQSLLPPGVDKIGQIYHFSLFFNKSGGNGIF